MMPGQAGGLTTGTLITIHTLPNGPEHGMATAERIILVDNGEYCGGLCQGFGNVQVHRRICASPKQQQLPGQLRSPLVAVVRQQSQEAKQ